MRTLHTADEIAAEVGRVGAEIAEAYRGSRLTLVGVLTGGMVFLADLMRAIGIPHRTELVRTSSYRGTSTEPGRLAIDAGGLSDLSGRSVVVVDDILDSGQTLLRVSSAVREAGAASVASAALLWKSARTRDGILPDFCGFEIPDAFVVGYGLDFDGAYRHLPDIAVLDETDIARHRGERLPGSGSMEETRR
ncbi:MAG: phosphoribosyltransferase family protein [Planctomycetota bacterium]